MDTTSLDALNIALRLHGFVIQGIKKARKKLGEYLPIKVIDLAIADITGSGRQYQPASLDPCEVVHFLGSRTDGRAQALLFLPLLLVLSIGTYLSGKGSKVSGLHRQVPTREVPS